MPAFLAPLAIAGIGALGSWLQGRNQNKLANTRVTTTTENEQSSSSSASSTRNPLYTAEQNAFLSQLIERVGQFGAVNPIEEARAITADAIFNINRGSSVAKRLAQEQVMASGGGGLASAILAQQQEQDRISQVISEQNKLPVLTRALEAQKLDTMSQFANTFQAGESVSSETSSRQSSKGTSTGPAGAPAGSPLLQAGSDLSQILAGLLAQGAFRGNTPAAPPPSSQGGINVGAFSRAVAGTQLLRPLSE